MITLEELNAKMIRGGALMKFQDPEVLFEIASRGKTYVEIGTRWGGSAIVAGLAGCEVHCIDPWEYPNKHLDDQTTPADVRENWKNAGLDPYKLFIHQQRHPPWPEVIKYQNFHIGMIDGAHTEKQVKLDWEAMKEHITKYVLFHDIHKRIPEFRETSPGVVFQRAGEETDWTPVELDLDHQYGILRAPSS